jgi:VanZ family protein
VAIISRRSGRLLLWVVTLAWAAQIFDFSTATFGGVFTAWLLSQILHLLHVTVSYPTFQLLHHLMRKAAHLTVYGIFSMLLYFSLGGSRSREWQWKTALGALLLAGGYSLTDEYHQTFVPGRGPSIMDCGIDTIGALLGMIIVFVSCRLGNRRGGAASKEKVEAALKK